MEIQDWNRLSDEQKLSSAARIMVCALIRNNNDLMDAVMSDVERLKAKQESEPTFMGKCLRTLKNAFK